MGNKSSAAADKEEAVEDGEALQAVAAGLAEDTKFNEAEVQALYKTFRACAAKTHPPDRISAGEMGEALRMAGLSPARQEIARRLFHAFDHVSCWNCACSAKVALRAPSISSSRHCRTVDMQPVHERVSTPTCPHALHCRTVDMHFVKKLCCKHPPKMYFSA